MTLPDRVIPNGETPEKDEGRSESDQLSDRRQQTGPWAMKSGHSSLSRRIGAAVLRN